MADQEETVFLYVGTYADEPTLATWLVQGCKAKAVGSYDAVVVIRAYRRDPRQQGRPRSATAAGAAGAVVGLIFRPVLGAAAASARPPAPSVGTCAAACPDRTWTSWATCSRRGRRPSSWWADRLADALDKAGERRTHVYKH